MLKHCQGSHRVFVCVAPLRAQSCAQQHKIWVMNGASSLVWKISHLNKFSRSNILNKAQRQPCVLVWRLDVSGETFYVTQQRRMYHVANGNTALPITQHGCHGGFLRIWLFLKKCVCVSAILSLWVWSVSILTCFINTSRTPVIRLRSVAGLLCFYLLSVEQASLLIFALCQPFHLSPIWITNGDWKLHSFCFIQLA